MPANLPVLPEHKAHRAVDAELLPSSPRPRVTRVVNEDTRLIELALNGDSAAFGQLVRRHQDRLFNTLFHMTGSREEAEDVVQDTFVQAFTKLNDFQQRSSFYTWVYRIAFNLSVSRRRRRRPEVSIEVGRELAGHEPADVMDSPLQQLERQERVRLVRLAIDSLEDKARTILVLRSSMNVVMSRLPNC